MPPIYNYLMTAIEVYLENHFIENFRKVDGTKYSDSEEWLNDFDNFKSQVSWISKDNKNAVRKGFSFQRLESVNILFKNTLGFELASYPRYKTVLIMFQKRHLFTHKAGIIDKKFIDKYNTLKSNNSPDKLLDYKQLGHQAYIEVPWVYDSIKEAKLFVYWTEMQVIGAYPEYVERTSALIDRIKLLS